jgi:hypothetical protein
MAGLIEAKKRIMSTDVTEVPAIACTPGAIDPADRAAHFELARTLLSSCSATREPLPNGISFRLPSNALEAVMRFVANERKCCPFMTFDIRVQANGGPVLLNMTGPAGTCEVIEAELGVEGLCGCQ